MMVQRTDVVRVVVNVPESDISLTRRGTPVDLDMDTRFPDCKVSRIGFALNERTHTMPVEIDVSNPKGLLRPGKASTVTLHLAKGSPTAFTIPQSALAGCPAREVVWIYVVRNGEAHRIQVRLGQGSEVEEKVEVLSVLQATDRIVSDPKGLTGDVVPVEVK
jgi:hypothetical protein